MKNPFSLTLEQILNDNSIPYKKEQINKIENNALELQPSLVNNLQKIINSIESLNEIGFQKSNKTIDELVKQCQQQKNSLSLIDPQQQEQKINTIQENISSIENAKQAIDRELIETKDLLGMQMGELIAYPMQMQEYISSTNTSNYQRVVNLQNDLNRQFLIGITYLMRDQKINRSVNFPQNIQWRDVQTLFRSQTIKEAMRDYDILLLQGDSAESARQCFVNFEQDNQLSSFWEWFQICLQYYEQVQRFAPLKDRVKDLSFQSAQMNKDIDQLVKDESHHKSLLQKYEKEKKDYEDLTYELVQHNYYCWQEHFLAEKNNIEMMLNLAPKISFSYAIQQSFQHLNVKESNILQQSVNKKIGTSRTYVMDYPFLLVKFYILQHNQINFIFDDQNLIDIFIEYLEKKHKIVVKTSYSECTKQFNCDYIVVYLDEIQQINHFKQLNVNNQHTYYLVIIPVNQLTQYQQLYENEFINLNSDLDNFFEYQQLYLGKTNYQQYNLFTEEELYQFINILLEHYQNSSTEQMYNELMTNSLILYQKQQQNDYTQDYQCEMVSLFKSIEGKLYNIQQQKHLYHILKSINLQNSLNLFTFIEQIINAFLQYSSNCNSLPEIINQDYILEIITSDMIESPLLMQQDCVVYLKIYAKFCQLCHTKSVNLVKFSEFIKNETININRQQKQSSKIKQLLINYLFEQQDIQPLNTLKQIQSDEQHYLQQLFHEIDAENLVKQDYETNLVYNKNIQDILEKKVKNIKSQKNQTILTQKLQASLCFEMVNDKIMSLELYLSIQMLFYLLNFGEATYIEIRQQLTNVEFIKKLNKIRIIDVNLINIQKYKEQREKLKLKQKLNQNYLIRHLNNYFNQIDKHICQAEEYIFDQVELKKIKNEVQSGDEQIQKQNNKIDLLKEQIDIQKRIVVKSIYVTKVQEEFNIHYFIQKIINQEIQRIELTEKFIELFQKEVIFLTYLKSANYPINHLTLFFVLKQFQKNQNLLNQILTNKSTTINAIIKKVHNILNSNVKKNHNLRKIFLISLIKKIIQKYIKY